MTLILAQNLSCTRGSAHVFARLSFALEKGGLLHLQGSNGAGKSSLLALAAGLLKTSGALKITAPFHYLARENGLNPKMTIEENLLFLAALLGDKNAPPENALRLWHAQHLLGLMPAHLSAGQARAVALARLSLVARPLWLLDEPFASLDSKRQTILKREIDNHLQTGGAVMIAEHHKDFGQGEVINMDQFNARRYF